MSNSERKLKVLFLASNPKDQRQLNVQEEMRIIDNELLLYGKFRDKFELVSKFAVRVEEITLHLRRVKPDVVHFSGHGSMKHELLFLKNNKTSHPIPPDTLSRVFKLFSKKILLVVLNACYSSDQAIAISKNIECVVGVSGEEIKNSVALDFARGFYRGIGFGEKISEAVESGYTEMLLKNPDTEVKPELETKNPDSGEIILIQQ